ncbi:glycosyltransferase family 2 protein [Cohnella panacarvi]|uniref:glycosyltransferase family 2 protein n=1 Tax=Cohnella panacarvi TaxID=400776 RepID=UPI00047DABDC|nr:glycosyltransferase family 2 protein [Cohnella panacarvi]
MISLAMIVKNEEKYLDRCLKSAAHMVDEIIVVDTGSTDRTVEIAEQYDAKLYRFEWIDDFAAARNYSLEHVTGDWVLVLDADQYFQEDFSESIKQFTNSNAKRAGLIEIISKYEQNGQTLHSTDYMARLFPRGARFEGRIHEQLTPLMPTVVTGLKLMHDGYFQTDKGTRNIPLLLKALEEEPDDAYLNFQLGKQYRGADEYNLAQHYTEKAYGLLQGSNPPFALETIIELLEVLTVNKQYEAALELASNEVEWLDKSPDFAFSVAQFLLEYAIDAQDFSVVGNIENSYLKCLELGRAGAKEIVIGASTYLAAYNLAVFYESIGNDANAKEYYALSDSYGYEPAKERLQKYTS